MRVICINDSNVFHIYKGGVYKAIKDEDGFKLYIPKVDDWVFYERYRVKILSVKVYYESVVR